MKKKGQDPNILLVEDHEIVALGMKTLLGEEGKHWVVDYVTSARKALSLALTAHYDLYIIDMELPDQWGTELVKQLRDLQPDAAFLFHTIHDEIWNLQQMLAVGANGIVLKNDNMQELKEAIDCVLAGGEYYSTSFAESCKELNNEPKLTARERHVLQLIADGLSSNEIADALFVTSNTIEFHRKRIIRKLGVQNVAQLVKVAIQKGYIQT